MSVRLIAPAVVAALLVAAPAFAAPDLTPRTWTNLATAMKSNLRETDNPARLKEDNPVAAQRCSELRRDFDRTIAQNKSSPQAVDARVAAEDGGQLCASGLYDVGIAKLQKAIDEVSKPTA